jgi:hypothetical protein
MLPTLQYLEFCYCKYLYNWSFLFYHLIILKIMSLLFISYDRVEQHVNINRKIYYIYIYIKKKKDARTFGLKL